MQKTVLSQETKIFGLVLLLGCSVLLCLKLWPVNTRAVSKQSALPRVENKAESLQYVSIGYVGLDGESISIEQENKMVKLRVKNISKKGVTGYSLTFGNHSEIAVDLIIGGKVISSGQTEDIIFPASSLNNPLNADEMLPVTIAFAVFDDHSSEGDFKIDKRIRDERRGIKTQLQLISQILNDAQTSTEKTSLLKLKNIKYHISTSSEKLSKIESEAFRSGAQFAQEMTKMFLEDLDRWEMSGRTTNLTRGELGHCRDVDEGFRKIAAWADSLINKY